MLSGLDLLKSAMAAAGFDLTGEQAERFMAYRRILLEWNAKMNLTAVTEPDEVILKHFADSAAVAARIVSARGGNAPADGENLLDVGTGAGFPGVPAKILLPGLRLVLLDSLNKRITFLKALAAGLGLDGVEFLHARAEDAARTELRGSFGTVASRAVASLPALAEYCLPFVRTGGRFIAMKGPSPEQEISAAAPLISALGGGGARTERAAIPFTDIAHTLIIIEKTRPTPVKYPRTPKKIGAPLRG